MQNHRVGLCLAMNMVTRDQSKVTGAPRQDLGRIIVPTPCTHPKLHQPGKRLINSRAHMHALGMVMHPKDPKRAHGHHLTSLDQPHTLATPAGAQCGLAHIYKLYRGGGTKFRPPCIIYIDVHTATLSLAGRCGYFPGGTGRPASPLAPPGKYTQRLARLSVVLHAHI